MQRLAPRGWWQVAALERAGTGRRLLLTTVTALLLGGLGSGCASLASRAASDYATNLTRALQAQPDPELVRQGTPAFMLAMDGLLESNPDSPRLLLAATQAYSSYAQAFLTRDEDKPRAARLAGRAREYGLRLLSLQPRLATALNGTQDDLDAALRQCRKTEVPALYAAGNAWLAWILASSDSMKAVAELPKAMAVMTRVLELDPAYEHGAAHLVFGIYYAAQPHGAGQDLPRSKQHFEAALQFAADGYILPSVVYAEFYGKATLDEPFFKQTLTKALEADLEKRPELRLLNTLARERAEFLLAHSEDYF